MGEHAAEGFGPGEYAQRMGFRIVEGRHDVEAAPDTRPFYFRREEALVDLRRIEGEQSA